MPSLTPNPSGVGRSGAAGGGARSGHTCSAPESTALPRCLRCRWLQRLQDAMRAQCQPLHHLWLLSPTPWCPSYLPRPPLGAPPAGWPLAWCPRFPPTDPPGECAYLGTGRAVSYVHCHPTAGVPTPQAQLTRCYGVGAHLHHLLPTRIVGVGLCQRLHAEVPGFADGQEAFMQRGSHGGTWGWHCHPP